MTRSKLSSRDIVTLQKWENIKPWQQDNEYILRHYRPCSNDHWKSIASLSYLHNQTVNVVSHLLGALIFVAAGLGQCYSSSPSIRYSIEDRIVLAFFFVGAIFCFSSSAYFHLIGNHSPKVYDAWLTMDFLGIIGLIVGTAFPLAYYTYPCHPRLLQACLTAVRFCCPTSMLFELKFDRYPLLVLHAPCFLIVRNSGNEIGGITGQGYLSFLLWSGFSHCFTPPFCMAWNRLSDRWAGPGFFLGDFHIFLAPLSMRWVEHPGR